GKMARPVKVKGYCSTVDILPTSLSLFDVDYDSRLLAGRDVLSDSMHVAILKNRSFLSELLAFDSATGEVTYFVEGDKVPDWYLDAVNEEIERRLALSQRILDTDYYRYLYDVLAGKAS
ncbi:MAG: LTA synthase family protein, partial [Clostridia bacterium]|nr:LTA synthase family protein [Clostridia bacterium]